MEVVCHKCKKVHSFMGKVGFRDECADCREDLHICKNCEFYDPKVYNECRETSADVVREKDRANYCEFFNPRSSGPLGEDPKAKIKAAAEALFKK